MCLPHMIYRMQKYYKFFHILHMPEFLKILQLNIIISMSEMINFIYVLLKIYLNKLLGNYHCLCSLFMFNKLHNQLNFCFTYFAYKIGYYITLSCYVH